jgi:hypothetical protein
MGVAGLINGLPLFFPFFTLRFFYLMSWTLPTVDWILDALPEDEAELYRNLQSGGQDRLENMLPRLVGMIRSKVRACARNVEDPDETTIPPECEDALLAIVRHRLVAVTGETAADDDPRVREYREALKYLDSLARCESLVTPGATSATSGVSLVSSRTRVATRDNLKGLL